MLLKANFIEYLLIKLHKYNKSKSSNYNLWELFYNNFEGFSIKNFRNSFIVIES